MPQPALSLDKYLSTQLPAVRENFPAGGGATGERKPYDGVLTGVSLVDDFTSKVTSCMYHPLFVKRMMLTDTGRLQTSRLCPKNLSLLTRLILSLTS